MFFCNMLVVVYPGFAHPLSVYLSYHSRLAQTSDKDVDKPVETCVQVYGQTEAADHFRIPLSTLNQKIKRLSIEIKKKGRE